MQTFLPYPSFTQSARVLDRQRLGKQRVEGMQILKVLLGLGKVNKNGTVAWSNHPAVKMWAGYEKCLIQYTRAICDEWMARGYKDTVKEKIRNMWNENRSTAWDVGIKTPWWFGLDEFHSAHRQTLLEKDPTHYGQFKWKEKPKYEYWWPTEHEE